MKLKGCIVLAPPRAPRVMIGHYRCAGRPLFKIFTDPNASVTILISNLYYMINVIQSTLLAHSGHTMGTLWVHHGYTMGTSWAHSGEGILICQYTLTSMPAYLYP